MSDIRIPYLLPGDEFFLKYIHAVKVSTYEQIQRDCYSSLKVNTVGGRLRRLEENKFIRITLSRSHRGRNCLVSISKKGFEKHIQDKSIHRKELLSDAIGHDLNLVDIRYAFKNFPSTTMYYTENEIQTWDYEGRELNSDAIVISKLKKREFSIPIEYELHMKEKKRYEPIIKKYYNSKNHPFVFFIAESDSIIEKVEQTERNLFDWEKPKFFYQTRKNFISEKNYFFTNGKGKVLDLTFI